MKKRFLSVIICIAVIICSIPMSASALTSIYNIGITGIDVPVAGANPDYIAEYNNSITLDAGNNHTSYYKNGICWYDMTTGSIIQTNATFKEGHQYKVTLYIKAADGFTFPNNVSITVNNNAATETDRFNDESIVAEFVFDTIPTYTPITSMIYRTSINPIAGNELETVMLKSINDSTELGTALSEWDGAWYVNDTKTSNPSDYELYTGSVYTPNVAFAFRTEITLKDGFIFTNESYISLNTTIKTIECVFESISQDKKTAVCYFFLDPLSAIPISNVEYTLNNYELGKNITGISIDSTSQVITNGNYGTDYFITISNRMPIMTGAFETDTTYTLYIEVKSNVYDVSALTKYNIWLNGKQATATEIYGGKLFAIFYLPRLEIPTVEITHILLAVDVIKPTAGAPFFYPTVYSVNGDENLKNAVVAPVIGESYGWYKSDFFIPYTYDTYVEAPDKFEANKAYSFFARLDAADGYTISNDCFIFISTPDGLMNGTLYERDIRYVCYEFYYNLGAPTKKPVATNANVKLSNYTKGKAIEGIDVSITINGNEIALTPEFDMPLYGMFYAILDANNNFIESGIFEYDTDYTLSVILFAHNYNLSSLKAEDILLSNRKAVSIKDMGEALIVNFKLPQLKKPIPNPFSDVKQGAYYYDSVLWAVQNNITAGVSATTFCPSNTCTRAQVVSFLWRAAGSPEPKSTTNPFSDVKSSAYYYKAVLWAVENNITAGVSATSFAPNADCTRGQIGAFLWRSQGSPKAKSSNPFSDVKTDAYYYDAVLWAVKNNITAGMSATSFAPNSPCTRGQIVCFLDRCLN